MCDSTTRVEERLRREYKPKVIAQRNNYQFKLVRVEGDFVWHGHPETDEAFIVIDGELVIDFWPGEMYVVPRG